MPRHKTATSYGGTRGNKAGDQSKAAAKAADARLLRLRMRQAMSRQVQHLEAIADGSLRVERPFGKDAQMIVVEPDFADRIKAIATLGTFGIGTKQDVTSDEEKLAPTQTIIIGGHEVKF